MFASNRQGVTAEMSIRIAAHAVRAFALAALAAIVLTGCSLGDTDTTADHIAFTDVTIASGGARAAQVSMTLNSNNGDELKTATVAGAASTRLTTAGGAAAGAIKLPPGVPVRIGAGAYRIAATGLARPPKAGDTVPVVLTFGRSHPITVNAAAR